MNPSAAGSGHPGTSVNLPDPMTESWRNTKTHHQNLVRLSRGSSSGSDKTPWQSIGPTACAGWNCLTSLISKRSSFTTSIPLNFAGSRDFLGGDAAADLLLHWRKYFGLKQADDRDRGILIAEITNLTAAQKQIAAQYPSATPIDSGRSGGRNRVIARMPPHEKNGAHNSYANILWVKKGGMLGRHRHRGRIYACTLEGEWRYLEYDWVARPGSYVLESPGAVHTLVSDNPEGMKTIFFLNGSLEFLDDNDNLLQTLDVFWFINHYVNYCRERGIPLNKKLWV